MAQIKKKFCMLGAFGVGKTSLVAQFVHSIFSEKYMTTVGVKLDRKDVCIEGRDVCLMIWDLHGEDEFMSVKDSYLRGSSAMLFVSDGTRPETVRAALDIRRRTREAFPVPALSLVNKNDLTDEWRVAGADLDVLEREGLDPRTTSAKTGENVEGAFRELARRTLA